MSKSRTRQLSRQMIEVQKHVDHWRSNGGGRGTRMPEELWQMAIEVARKDGIYTTARRLHLDYCKLKKRTFAASKAITLVDDTGASGFVELKMARAESEARTVLELVGRDGDQMRVDFTGTPLVDLVKLTQAFLGQEE